MTNRLSKLLTVVARDHFPRQAPKKGALSALEKRIGHELPADVRAFYTRHDGASLFDTSPSDAYELLPTRRWTRPRACPKSWYAFCDVGDGNSLALDLASIKGGRCNVIDVFHETPDEGTVIAKSFTEFLERALASEGEHFWLSAKAKPKDKGIFSAADLAEPDGQLLAWVEQERGRPVIRWELTLSFATLKRGATEIVPQLVIEMRDDGLRDWRKLRVIHVPSKKAKAVVHWATFTKKSGSNKPLKPRKVHLAVTGRRGNELSFDYAIELRPPGSGWITAKGNAPVEFSAFVVTEDVLEDPTPAEAAKVLGRVAVVATFGKPKLNAIGEAEAKPRG